MEAYRHHVSGFFPTRADAEAALVTLLDQGLPRERLHLYDADARQTAEEKKSDGVLKDVLVDGAIGTAVGTGVGALGTVALAASSVTLLVASPLVAALMMLGWGASVGGLIGAATGAANVPHKKEGWLSDLVEDAISSGQFVLVAETRSEQETALVREVVETAMAAYRDTDTTAA